VLAGFAVISHWAPHLLFGVYFGALADRYDCRRIIQASQLLYLGVSLTWSVLFLTGAIEVWHAVILLTLHGLGSAIGSSASQLIIHEMVGRKDLQSGVRLSATGRNLGFLVGPAVGGALLLAIGPGMGMLVNSLVYLPLIIWLSRVPYTGHANADDSGPRRRGLGLRDAWVTLRAISHNRPVIAMVVLVGGSSFLVGSAFQAQMPEFAHDLGTDEAGMAYSALVAAHAVGGAVGGLLLEGTGLFGAQARTALLLGVAWCVAIAIFAASPSYPLALAMLALMGLLHLAFSAMAQTLVQLEAPPELRGRVIGLFNMAQLGLRVGSGFTVGVLGGFIGIHWSLGLSAAVMLLLVLRLLAYLRPARRLAPASAA
jgi:MFS family permease